MALNRRTLMVVLNSLMFVIATAETRRDLESYGRGYHGGYR